jgi:hypothetical protein
LKFKEHLPKVTLRSQHFQGIYKHPKVRYQLSLQAPLALNSKEYPSPKTCLEVNHQKSCQQAVLQLFRTNLNHKFNKMRRQQPKTIHRKETKIFCALCLPY